MTTVRHAIPYPGEGAGVDHLVVADLVAVHLDPRVAQPADLVVDRQVLARGHPDEYRLWTTRTLIALLGR